MSIDLLSNMVSALKNASKVGINHIEMPHSKMCEDVAKVLKQKGFLTGVKAFKVTGKSHKKLGLDLTYKDGNCLIKNTKRISKPGRRIYRSANELCSVKGGKGVLVVSTSRGVMDGFDARKKKLGGELVCEVY
ncbi:30S ribosomal protein S8 [Patescibacteria group bacterium]|nr:30S ribosomal protein S8 [Patescibacteria group bacterium]